MRSLMMELTLLVTMMMMVSLVSAKVSLFLSSDQTKALYGIDTKDGLYYIREGVVNKYAMNFQHQVIPADVDHIDFTWEAKKGSAVPYKITFIHAPSRAMNNPSVNISTEGIVPTHADKFRLYFPCTGKVAEQVETLFQISFSIRRKSPEVLNFKRIKVCKLAETPQQELVSDPLSALEDDSDPTKSVLLSSVSPSLFVILGAVSASVILLTVIMAGLYIRTIRKRDAGGHGGQLRPGESLRSSLQLSPEDMEYCEKSGLSLGGHHEVRGAGGSHCTVTMSSSDSYDTLASFTQVPINRIDGPAWASHNDYAAPLASHKAPGILTPIHSHGGHSWRQSQSCAASPRPPPASRLVYTGPDRGWGAADLTPSRRVRPAQDYTGSVSHHYQYSTVAQAMPGEASPYSVSSELYKHVLPGYFSHTTNSRAGSVLV